MLRAAALMGIVPAQFWKLSLREWRALTTPSGPALPRKEFDLMMKTRPDERTEANG
ncbi:MAG TPA: phage tail assembly chaperone [Henriciella marina]|uniref:phage tail assembly chaperone n=1 Tax=Henriciella sp. TaxID=1968823 RepID=UPI00182F1580|nr:phage tail assembly chaperone [Henriciella sp.]HIG21267.1 phage tail assembly chaperone [Henriciella sp.]HIK63748.1 phage tail assembly chaperone [Henriciella marina]